MFKKLAPAWVASMVAITAAYLIAFLAPALFAATPRPLLDMSIPVPNAKPIPLKSYRGKVLLVAVISTDCGPCVATIDILNRLQKEYGPKGFQAVAAAGDPNAQYMLGPFVARYRPTFPMGYLTEEQIRKIGDIGPKDRPFVPICIFVDRQGIVRQQVFGDSPFFKAEEASMRKVIEAMLK